MSKPDTHSMGVSSFSCQQDLAKLRECLGSAENDDEAECSITNTKSDTFGASEYPKFRDNYTYPNDRSHSRITVRSIDDTSLVTETTSLRQDDYLRDHSLEAALVTNEMYQEALNEAIARLEMSLIQNLERQEWVQYELDSLTKESPGSSPSNVKCKVKMKHWLVLTAPYLKDNDGFAFPENSDAKERSKRTESSPFLSHPLNWTKHEQAVLHCAVKSNCRKNLMQPLLQKKDILCLKLKMSDITEQDKAEITSKLELVNSQMNSLKSMNETQLVDQPPENLDWMQISTIELNGFHSPDSCKLMWCKVLHPSIYKGSWTDQEENRLVEAVNKFYCRDWDAIAEELGSKRTAEQCIRRYNQHLNPETVLTGPWSDLENTVLKEAIERHQIGNTIPWNKVSSYLEGRQPHHVRQHWLTNINERKRGQWSMEEDIVLLMSIKKYGMIFEKIYKLLPGRTSHQCRERYISTLNLQVNFDKWTIEEDRKLISVAKEIGTKWSCIAEQLRGRTANMIRQRYFVLIKNIPDAYERVEYDSQEWPLVSSHSNFTAIERRKKVYDYLKYRTDQLISVPSNQGPRMKRTIRKRKTGNSFHKETNNTDSAMDDGFTSVLRDPDHVNFLLAEAKKILSRSEKGPQERIRTYKPKSSFNSVDKALDDLLLPSLTCKRTGQKKLLAFSAKETLEFDLVKEALHNVFNVEVPLEQEKNKDATNEVEISLLSDDEENSQASSFAGPDQIMSNNSGNNVPTISKNTSQKGKLSLRDEVFARGVLSTLSKQCIGEKIFCKEKGEKSGTCVLPPTRTSVDAFKLMVMDRTRIAEIAAQVEDASLIENITGTGQPKCQMCLDALNELQAQPISTVNNSSTGQTRLGEVVKEETVTNGQPMCEDCARLARLRSGYMKLKDRFISLFFWPGQVFLTHPPEGSLEPSPATIYIPPPVKYSRKRKRGSRKSVPVAKPVVLDCGLPEKKKRKPKCFRYKNLAPVRCSTRKTTKD